MLKTALLSIATVMVTVCAQAGDYRIELGQYGIGQSPTGFVSVVSGSGKAGEWKVVQAEVPPLLAPFSPEAPKEYRPALTQTVADPTNERFPLLLLKSEDYGDFTVTTRFQNVSGSVSQAAGIAFRARDEKNYYVVCASTLDNYFRFYKSVEGVRSVPIGKKMPIPAGVWHELKVSCKGSEIRTYLDGAEALPALNDISFAAGKIGFWTKSDSVSYFMDTKIDFTPIQNFSEVLVRDTLKKYPQLLGLKLFAYKNSDMPRLLAGSNEKEKGSLGGKVEADVIKGGHMYFLKTRKTVEVTEPLRDRNGEIVAAVLIVMKTFKGETEANALGRVIPIRKTMEEQLATVPGLEGLN